MNKINYILLLNSFFYILSSCIPLLGIKYMQYNYNYIHYIISAPLWEEWSYCSVSHFTRDGQIPY